MIEKFQTILFSGIVGKILNDSFAKHIKRFESYCFKTNNKKYV